MMDRFGAFVSGRPLRAAGAGAGPLAATTFAVKDLIDVAGDVTGSGNPDWRRLHTPAKRHAPVVERLLRAGASLAGKTQTDELAFSLEGANAHYGIPVNPSCRDRLPGGSSSGSAVAVAAGLVDFALGTDTGGSVRVPASFCGVFGFRPSHGRVPLDGVVPFAPSYDTVGWFARDGEMLARVGYVLLDGAATPAPTRFLVARDAFELCDPASATLLRRRLSRFGATEEVAIYGGDKAEWLECYRVLQGGEIWASLGGWITSNQPRFGPSIAARFADAALITPGEIARCAPVRERIASQLARLLKPGVALLVPTASEVAPHKDASDAEIGEFYRRTLTLTSVAGHARLPQLTWPATRLGGCPLGLSFIGARGDDEGLLALVRGLEAT